MSAVSTKKLLWILADEQNRCYYVEGGVVKKSSSPVWLDESPEGWKDINLQFATNVKYFSTLRSFSNAVKFIGDAKQIIAERAIKGAGTEEFMYLIILRNDPSQGLNYYELEYKSRLDFSKFDGDVRTGIGMNTLQDDVFSMVQANENIKYSLNCNSSNPLAIKVLFDGILLQDKVNYKILNAPITGTSTAIKYFTIPMFFFSNEGDSAGVIHNDPGFDNFSDPVAYVSDPANVNYAISFTSPTKVTIRGTMPFKALTIPVVIPDMEVFFMTSLNPYPVPAGQVVFSQSFLDNTVTYTVNINLEINLDANERLFFLASYKGFSFTPVGSDLAFIFSTKVDSSVHYGLRPLDALKDLVSQITKGRYTADSKFLARNNRKILISGSSLRSFPDAKILINFSDLFKGYSVPYNMGITVRNGVLFFEPISDIYNADAELMNLGEVAEAKLAFATEFIFTSAKVGYLKQNYNKRNGRFEFNGQHTYKFAVQNVLNELDLTSPIRTDPFGAEFIRTGYPNLDSTDDKGDADVWAIMISDAIGQTSGKVSTALTFTVETLILAAPVIKTPFSNTTIYFENPTITGIAQAGKLITVYVDGEIDGTTTSDSDGNWTYQIVSPLTSLSDINSGVHVIAANAQTDPDNISSFSKALTITINTTSESPFLFTAPTNNDFLYNNLPLITGIAPVSKTITLTLDGVFLATVVSDTSGLWSYQILAPISDGAHIIAASAAGLTDAPPITINVNKNVIEPLITSISYGDIIYNNLPLIKGVGIPGVVVPVYLDGGGGPVVSGVPGPLGTATIDANGDWSFQVTSVIDSNGITTAYIPDGLHVLSTTQLPENVPATISGFRLMRGANKGPVMDYDGIKLDDQFIPTGVDPSTLPPTLGQFIHPETLYNIEETTPLRILMAHGSILKPFLQQQPDSIIEFNGSEVNPNLVTMKDGIIFNEGADVNTSDLPAPLFHPFYLKFKAQVPTTFNDIMTSVNNDGYITTIVNDTTVYCLPLGSMNMKLATDEAQEWKLLVSVKTPLFDLLKLFTNGTSFKIGKNMVHFSDLNPLHFVKYNFTPDPKYHFQDIYDNWAKNRFPRWGMKPDYAQPFQKTDSIYLQAFTSNVGTIQIHMIDLVTANIVEIFPFTPVPGSLVTLPNVLQDVTIDLSVYPAGQYWFALFIDGAYVSIAEKISLQDDFPDTMLIEYGGSANRPDFFFTNGCKPMIRVESEFLPWTPSSEVDNFEDEMGDFNITRGIALKSRILQLGSERSLIPDWMAIKINQITLLTNYLMDGTKYTRNNDSKLSNEDFGPGVNEFMYKIVMTLADNQSGMRFDTPGDTGVHTTAYVLDATAFGQNAGVINVTAEETP
jgi:hypothetical protein